MSGCVYHNGTDKSGYNKLEAIIDINPDGDDPDFVKIYHSGASTDGTEGTSQKARALAYLAYAVTKNPGWFKCTGSYTRDDGEGHTITDYCTDDTCRSYGYQYSHASVAINNIWGRAKNELQSIVSGGSIQWQGDEGVFEIAPYTLGFTEGFSKYKEAVTAYDKDGYCINEDGEKENYSARLLYFSGDLSQGKIMLYGKANPVEGVNLVKYITKVESIGEDTYPKVNDDFGDDREEYDENKKEEEPVELATQKVKIYYTIKLKNESSEEVKGKLKDVYDTEFLSNLECEDGDLESGIDVTLAGDETKEFHITLEGNETIASGKYKNTAEFTPEGEDEPIESSDWVDVKPVNPDQPGINKYISVLNGSNQSRSEMNEEEKQNDPADAGEAGISKTITYTVEIKNPNDYEIKGKFSDTADSAIEIKNMSLNGTSITNDSEITIEASKTITIKITASMTAENAQAGTYKNTARFEFGVDVYESSDYLKIIGVDVPEMNKSISMLNGSSQNRSGMSEKEKQSSPADAGEAEEKKTITYTITIKNPNDYEIQGIFSDTADTAITIGSMTLNDSPITNGSEIIIEASKTITITITASMTAENAQTGIYKNTARFEFGVDVYESSDYLAIKPETPKAELKKYISNVEGRTRF